MKHHAYRQRDRGAALLGAIVITAIVVALTASIAQASRFGIASTSRLLESLDAEDTFAALEQAAARALLDDAARGNVEARATDNEGRTLTHAGPRSHGSASLISAQGRFNLNNLVPRLRNTARGNAGTADATEDVDDGLPGPARRPPTERNEPPTVANEEAPVPPESVAPSSPTLPAAAPTPAAVDSGSPGGVAPGGAPNLDLSPEMRRNLIAMLPAAAPWLLDPDAAIDGGAAPTVSATLADAMTATPAAGVAQRSRVSRGAALAALNDIGLPLALAGADTSGGPGAASARVPGTAAKANTQRLSDWEISVIRFSLLLDALELDQNLLPAILDWLDADNDTRYPGGAEDDFYMDAEDPYRAANRAFGDVSELRLVRGVDHEVYARLQPYISVLTAETDIDVNHAPAEVLMALGPGIDRNTAELLIAARNAQPYLSVEQFVSDGALAGRPVYDGGLTVDPTWFRLRMQATSGASRLASESILARNSPVDVRVLARRRSYIDE